MADYQDKHLKRQGTGGPIGLPTSVPISIGLTVNMNITGAQTMNVTVSRNDHTDIGSLSVFYSSYSGSTPTQNLAGQLSVPPPTPPGPNVTFPLTLSGGAPFTGFFSILVIDHTDNKAGINGYSIM